MQWQRNPVPHGQFVHGRALRGLDPVAGDARLPRRGLHPGVVRVEEDVQLGLVEVPLAGCGGGAEDLVGVVEDEAEVAQPAHAGLRADRRLPGLDAREAEGALLRLAGSVVEVDLLVGATGHAEPPAAAAVLVDQDDPVLFPLVHRAGRAGGDAGRVKAVLADARQVEHEHLLELHLDPFGEAFEVGVGDGVLGRAGQVVLEVAAPSDGHVPAGQGGDRVRARVRRAERSVDDGLVVVRPRIAVVVDGGQVRVVEDRQQLAQPAARPQLQPALAVQRPAAVPVPLVLVSLRVPDAGFGLDVVEVDVLGAGPVRPYLLAGHRAGVAADALIEVHHHGDVGHHPHQNSTSWARRRITVISSRWLPVGP